MWKLLLLLAISANLILTVTSGNGTEAAAAAATSTTIIKTHEHTHSNKDPPEPEGTEGTPGNGEDENTDPCENCEEKNCDAQGRTRPDGGEITCATERGDEGERTEDTNAGDILTSTTAASSENSTTSQATNRPKRTTATSSANSSPTTEESEEGTTKNNKDEGKEENMTTENSKSSEEPGSTTTGAEMITKGSGSEATIGGSGTKTTTGESGIGSTTRNTTQVNKHKKHKKHKSTTTVSSGEPHSSTNGSEMTTKDEEDGSGTEPTRGDSGMGLTTRKLKKKIKTATTASIGVEPHSSTDLTEITTEMSGSKTTTGGSGVVTTTGDLGTKLTTHTHKKTKKDRTTTTVSSENPKSDVWMTTEKFVIETTTKGSEEKITTDNSEDREATEHPESTEDSDCERTTEHPDAGSTTKSTDDSEGEVETTKHPDTGSTPVSTGDSEGKETTEHPDAGTTTESTDKSNTTTEEESESTSTTEASTTKKSTKRPRTTIKPSGETNTTPRPKTTRKPRTTTKKTKMPRTTTASAEETTTGGSAETTEASTTTKSTKRPRTTKKPSEETNTTSRLKTTRKPRTTTRTPKTTKMPRTTTTSGEETTTGGSAETTTNDSTMATTEQQSTTMRGPKDCKGRHKWYFLCAPSCPQKTCADYLNGVKYPINIGLPKCKPECRCEIGYYKDDEGNCLSTLECRKWAKSTTNAMTSSTATANPNTQDTTAASTTTMMSTTQPNCEDVPKELFIMGNLAYTIKLLSDMSERDPDNNMLIGGASILYLFAQIVLGVKGEPLTSKVKTELLKVFNLDEEQIRCLLPKISADLTTQYPDIEYSLFCKIYAAKGYALNDDFIQRTTQLFGIGPENLNSSSSEAAQKINNDVAKHTNDLFLNYVKPNTLSSMHGLVLVDAEGFQGKWEKPFDPAETIMKDFFSPGKIEKIPTMHQRGFFLYAYSARLNAKILKLRYSGGRFSLAIFVPSLTNGLNGLLSKMENPRNTASALDSLKYEKVEVSMPKFNVSVANMLKMSSEMAGIKEIFNNSTTGLKDIGSEKPPFVGEILQRNHYTVNEHGMGNKSEVDFHKPEDIPRLSKFAVTHSFNADRPFCYMLIFDKIVLFAGVHVN